MSAKKIQRVHEWQLDYKTARQRILRLSEKKLRRLRRKRKHVGRSRREYLLMKNVKSYITYEQIWEELQSDCSDSEDDNWDHIDHKKTSPEPLEAPTVEDSMDDAEPRQTLLAKVRPTAAQSFMRTFYKLSLNRRKFSVRKWIL